MKVHPVIKTLAKLALEKAAEVAADRVTNWAVDHLAAKYPPKAKDEDPTTE